ncbi:hypothetical protein LTS18_006432, partial [Coniosporium uncinatum]
METLHKLAQPESIRDHIALQGRTEATGMFVFAVSPIEKHARGLIDPIAQDTNARGNTDLSATTICSLRHATYANGTGLNGKTTNRAGIAESSHIESFSNAIDIKKASKEEPDSHRKNSQKPEDVTRQLWTSNPLLDLLSPTLEFVNESLFRNLSDPRRLLDCFRDTSLAATAHSPLSHLHPVKLEAAFRGWTRINGSLVCDSLWMALEALFTPPPNVARQRRTNSQRKDDLHLPFTTEQSTAYVNDEDAAHIIMVCIHALTSLVFRGTPVVWQNVLKNRADGRIAPDPKEMRSADVNAKMHMDVVDQLEYEPGLRLAQRLARAVAARRRFFEIQEVMLGKRADGAQ